MQMEYVTLYVDDIPAAMDFYEKVLKLSPRFVHESGDYAEMETGTTVLAFSHHDLAKTLVPQGYQKASPDSLPLGMQLGFSVDGVAETYNRALEHGAKPIAPPEEKPWGFKSAFIMDPSGHLIEFSRKMHPVNPS
ncbi:MAG: VOC family protein [Desulfovibrionales bacterium]|nr:VOC family protein [Desulfovibrionales bacterium]